jgi:VIT1/CCC1 family predicted Fe2+/Mn2+ transporter
MTQEHESEHHRPVFDTWFRASVFGFSDGLITNISLILGFVGANPGHSVVRLVGLTGLVAGAFSMASGEYISVRAQKELVDYEVSVERAALKADPEGEQKELRQIFIDRGIERELADRLSSDLMRDPELALITHVREELGIDPSSGGKPLLAASSSFAAFAVGALVPLVPWLLTASGNTANISMACAVVGSLAAGAVVGWFTGKGITRWAFRQLFIAALASGVTYFLGHVVGSN